VWLTPTEDHKRRAGRAPPEVCVKRTALVAAVAGIVLTAGASSARCGWRSSVCRLLERSEDAWEGPAVSLLFLVAAIELARLVRRWVRHRPVE
jgi:hypothetical protein